MSAGEVKVPKQSGKNDYEDIHIAACINHSDQASPIVFHAFAMAKALDAPVTLVHALESNHGPARPDPIEWDLRRHEIRRSLAQLASPPDKSMSRAEIWLADGLISDEIKRFTKDYADNMLVIGMPEPGAQSCEGISNTIHHLLLGTSGTILLVPFSARPLPHPTYQRILVPVDGSPWAASALPLAVRLAKANDAELVLAHVVPHPELTETGPYDAEDLELHQRVIERNKKTADAYLDRMRHNVADLGVRVRSISTEGKDVRVTLEKLVQDEAIDLVILSARGHGLTTNTIMPYGSVAGYLMMHSPAPLLVVPTAIGQSRPSYAEQPHDLRMPQLASA